MGEVAEQTVAAGAKSIIDQAVKGGISDIHIEPLPNFISVRYRHAGKLYVASKLPKPSGRLLAAYFKKQAGLDEKNVSSPQNGAIELKSGRRTIHLEVATMPVLDGEKVTLHLVEQTSKLPELEALGFWGNGLAAVSHALAQTDGLIFIADRQGNNIGMTIGSMLQTIEQARAKTAFIGSEQAMPAAVKKFAFGSPAVPDSRRLKMLAGQGFEVFGVELFKDKAAAETALELAADRKLVLAGTVASGIAAGINSLKYVGQNHLLAANMRVGLGQTFVRRLCERCREAYEPSAFEQKQLDGFFGTSRPETVKRLHELEKSAAMSNDLGSDGNSIQRLYKAKPGGCRYCDRTGHNGAIGVFEVCEPGDSLRGLIAASRSANTLQEAMSKDGMITLKTDGLVKALRGLIDLPTLLSLCL